MSSSGQWWADDDDTFIHTTHALSPKGYQRHLRYSFKTLTFYQNYLAMRNTVDVTGGKALTV
jgi:hypothetical protein